MDSGSVGAIIGFPKQKFILVSSINYYIHKNLDFADYLVACFGFNHLHNLLEISKLNKNIYSFFPLGLSRIGVHLCPLFILIS